VSHTFLARLFWLTFIPRIVDTSPSSVIFHRLASPCMTSSISSAVVAAMMIAMDLRRYAIKKRQPSFIAIPQQRGDAAR
jgi:threonine/homoserine/homoserine lactone efflux protein